MGCDGGAVCRYQVRVAPGAPISRGTRNRRVATGLGNVVAQCDPMSQVAAVPVWVGADVSTGLVAWSGACRSAGAGAVSAGTS